MFDEITFANPGFFWLFLLVPIMAAWYILRRKRMWPGITFSTSAPFKNVKPSLRIYLRHILPVLRIFAVSLLIIALARPQTSSSRKSISTEGIDIILALDISTSMLAMDFKPNRLEAAKKNAARFVKERPNDRIGLVVFAGESFTQCPITIDHDVLVNMLDKINTGMLEDGTAIGTGLATSVNRLKESNAKSKVIILLTDGVNNTGFVAPQTAAEIAKTFDIRVYTIGVGTKGKAPYPQKMRNPFTGEIFTRTVQVDVEIDEKTLQEIAATTDGHYFRATNNKSLEEIYKEIDEMEKTKIDVAYFSRHHEEFLPFALIAGGLFLLEILLRYTVFRPIP